MDVLAQLAAHAQHLDETDPLAPAREQFVSAENVISYLDGNSLGRPLKASRDAFGDFVAHDWGTRLIRSWDEQWMKLPVTVGDEIGRVTLGAQPGQTVVADSTTVMLYKLARAAVDAQPNRTQIVADTDNFPTDRFILEGIAAERGLTITWIEPEHDGLTTEQVATAVSTDTALVLLSHVDFRSAAMADMQAITHVTHDAGALILWDLCHATGAVELSLDAHGVDLAVGCTYKYLNGGPGAPAFGYVASRLQERLAQPIQGWWGSAEPFEMGPRYEPADNIRRFLSGTAPVVGMLPMQDMLRLIDSVGMKAVRQKSVALTEFAIEIFDKLLADEGVTLATPRDPDKRGSHVMFEHPDFRLIVDRLWKQGVIPDFRPPSGLRVGLSPLSTSFAELLAGLTHIHAALVDNGDHDG